MQTPCERRWLHSAIATWRSSWTQAAMPVARWAGHGAIPKGQEWAHPQHPILGWLLLMHSSGSSRQESPTVSRREARLGSIQNAVSKASRGVEHPRRESGLANLSRSSFRRPNHLSQVLRHTLDTLCCSRILRQIRHGPAGLHCHSHLRHCRNRYGAGILLNSSRSSSSSKKCQNRRSSLVCKKHGKQRWP